MAWLEVVSVLHGPRRHRNVWLSRRTIIAASIDKLGLSLCLLFFCKKLHVDFVWRRARFKYTQIGRGRKC